MGREELKRNVDNGLCLGAKYLSGGKGIKSKARDNRGKGQREISGDELTQDGQRCFKNESNSRPAGIMWFWNAERERIRLSCQPVGSVLWDWAIFGAGKQ
jgi:hypothetical protein